MITLITIIFLLYNPQHILSQQYQTSIGAKYDPRDFRPSSYECGGNYRRKEEWIYSPRYPSNYDNSLYCVYTIHKYKMNVCKIELQFSDFDLEDTRPYCNSDYFEIKSKMRMCGVLLPESKYSINFPDSSTTIKLVFRSDSRRTRKGFMAHIRQIENSCGYRDFNRGQTKANLPIPFDRNCDAYIKDFFGIIKSPNFPAHYPSNKLCTYKLIRPAAHVCKVEIALRSFNVKPDAFGRCEDDYFELPDGKRLCGYRDDTITLPYKHSSDFIILKFHSDYTNSGAGFNIEIRQIPYSCDMFTQLQGYKCDETINGDIYRLRSPNYPSKYLPNQQCIYTIQKSNSNICYFTLDFIEFNLPRRYSIKESLKICDQDYLQLPDGTKLCGDITGTKSFMFPQDKDQKPMMQFISDNYTQGFGFDIVIKQLPCGPNGHRPAFDPILEADKSYCNRVIFSELDVITSPNYPRDYGPFSRCSYIIHRSSPDVCKVQLEFLNFDIETTSECRADYLLIESINEKYCGLHMIPDKIITFPSNSDNIRLSFISDGQVHRPGFEIRIKQHRNSCHKPSSNMDDESFNKIKICDTSSDINTVFRSSNYPLSYDANTDCLYKLKRHNPSICRAEITFSDFSVGAINAYSLFNNCGNEYLEIDNVRYCGYKRGEIITLKFPQNSDYIPIHFKTDTSNNFGGFRIDIRQISERCITNVDGVAHLYTNTFCTNQTYQNTTFQLISPIFQTGSYPDNVDCKYTIIKSSYDVCALEVVFNLFDLQESSDCSKDFLKISDIKVCGKLPLNSKRTYEFVEDKMNIVFQTDQSGTGAGFFLNVRQIHC